MLDKVALQRKADTSCVTDSHLTHLHGGQVGCLVRHAGGGPADTCGYQSAESVVVGWDHHVSAIGEEM